MPAWLKPIAGWFLAIARALLGVGQPAGDAAVEQASRAGAAVQQSDQLEKGEADVQAAIQASDAADRAVGVLVDSGRLSSADGVSVVIPDDGFRRD